MAEAEKASAVSIKGRSSSSDSLAILSSKGVAAAGLERHGASGDEAEKAIDSEVGEPNSSYDTINLFEARDFNKYSVFNHGLVPLEIWTRSLQLYYQPSGRIRVM